MFMNSVASSASSWKKDILEGKCMFFKNLYLFWLDYSWIEALTKEKEEMRVANEEMIAAERLSAEVAKLSRDNEDLRWGIKAV